MLFSSIVYAHPDGIKPYWYPSSYVFGFVKGCWVSFSERQAFTEFWPEDVQEVCGCVLDSLRHSMEFHDVDSNITENTTTFDKIVSGVLPVCILEQTKRKKEKEKTQ